MSHMTPLQIRAVATASLGVIEAVEAGGENGAPAGVVYAAMQAQGASFNQFMSLMTKVIRPGYLTLVDNCYRSTPTTQDLKTKLTNILAAFAS
jgi:Neuraminidase (sialidase)